MISICCPSRGRPELARRMYDSVKTTQKYSSEILFYLNEDDPCLNDYTRLLPEETYDIGPDQSTAMSWNHLAKKSTKDFLMLAGDDIQFKTPNWDQVIIDQGNHYPDGIYCITWDDGRQNKKSGIDINDIPLEQFGCAHYVIHRKCYDALGYLANPIFWHWCVDTYIKSLMLKLERFIHTRDKILITAKKITDDDTAKRIRKTKNINKRDLEVEKFAVKRYLQSDVESLQKLITSRG